MDPLKPVFGPGIMDHKLWSITNVSMANSEKSKIAFSAMDRLTITYGSR